MMSREQPPEQPATSSTPDALHEIELGTERFHRAHGHLIAFHHNIGRGMNHFATAEPLLRASGHDALADQLRNEHLPRGVIPANDIDDGTTGRWSYDVLEQFQQSFLADILAFSDEAHAQINGGRWHEFERSQEYRWKHRAIRK